MMMEVLWGVASMSVLSLMVSVKVKSEEFSYLKGFLLSLWSSLLPLALLSVGVEESHWSVFSADGISTAMNFLCLWVWCLIVLGMPTYSSVEMLLCSYLVILMSILFFFFSNLIYMFVTFEFSVIPTLLIVMGLGNQPERLKAGRFLIMYMILSGLFLFLSVLYCKHSGISTFTDLRMSAGLTSPAGQAREILFWMMIITFLVKMPLFFFHSWLPKAHVEAPLEGSILLAAILLKLGSMGVIRLLYCFQPSSSNLMVQTLATIGLWGGLISSFLCLSSSDLKLCVAYASVSHMNMSLSGLLTFKGLALKGAGYLMLGHGMCASALFFMATILYKSFGSRNLLLSSGGFSATPVMVMMNLCVWSLNFGCPPSLPFISEVISVICIASSFTWVMLIICLLNIVISSTYSMSVFGVQSHSKGSPLPKGQLQSILSLKNFILWGLWVTPLVWLFFDQVSINYIQ
uniref:NADH-ubiquinone oxidoreductase chain 4 n=1 Tax=Haematomyzus elephantis TaxID=160133 RepID=A0A0R5QN24_9NEOP|nr:NADH dehydrogenase subunit 4 [Haematomyzus elephantis]